MEETWRWMLDESGSNEKKDGGGRLKREWRGRRRGRERERDGGGIARSVHHSQS